MKNGALDSSLYKPLPATVWKDAKKGIPEV